MPLVSTIEPALVDVPEYSARAEDVETVHSATGMEFSHQIAVVQAAALMTLTYGAATIRWHHGRVQRLELSYA